MKIRQISLTAKDVHILELEGDFDLFAAADFYTLACSSFEKCQHVHIDLQEVYYLDSSGIGSIIKLLQKAKTSGKLLTFFGIEGSPRKVLSMCNILPLLKEVDLAKEGLL